MVKVYAVTRTVFVQDFRGIGIRKYWKYDDVESVGGTFRAACRRIKCLWKITGCAEERGEEWHVKSYRYIRHPYLELIQDD